MNSHLMKKTTFLSADRNMNIPLLTSVTRISKQFVCLPIQSLKVMDKLYLGHLGLPFIDELIRGKSLKANQRERKGGGREREIGEN